MKTLVPALLAVSAAFAAPAAMADDWYVDGGYSFIDIDVDTVIGSADIDLGAIGGHFGYNATPYVGLEGEVLVGVEDEEATSDGITASVGLNYLIGAYGKLQAPLGEKASVFARAGVVSAEAEVSATGFGSASDTETGAGYGVGGLFHVNDRFFVRGDYTRYDVEDIEADTFMISVGLAY